MKKLLLIILIAQCFLLGACKKFLEEDPKSQVTPTNFYRTPTDAITAVNSVYVALLRSEVINLEHFWLNEMAADDAFYTGSAVADRDGMNLLTFNALNGLVQKVWENRYKAINRANEVLLYVNATNAGNVSARVRAEACFLRAFAYFDLVRWFGDVPLFTGLSAQDPYPVKAPAGDVYKQIIEDLKYAENNLDDTYDYMSKDGGRATKGAAKALLGKVYLTMSGYPLKQLDKLPEAEKELKEIIDNKALYGYEFMPNYRDMFPIAPNDNNKKANTETIFYTRGNATLSAQSGSWSFNRLAQWIISYGFRASVDAFASSDTSATAVYDKKDLRRKANFGAVKGAYPTTSSNPYTITDLNNKDSNATVTTVKYLDIINGNNSATDFVWIRYSDVLLMYAETLIEQNKSLSVARDYINMTRNRAGIGNTTATTQEELRQELRAERRREFFFEGLRRNDLIRWGIFPTAVKDGKTRSFRYYKKADIGDLSYIDDPRALLFPIPNNEIVTNPNMVQNEGY